MSPWGWSPERTQGIWRYGAGWLRPFAAAVPWITVLLLMLMMHMVGGTFTSEKGVLFDLPEGSAADGEPTGLVALVMPMPRETLVFFDDARYTLGDGRSAASLAEHLGQRVGRLTNKTMLVLADRRVPMGELMKFASIARQGGVSKVLFAERKAGAQE